MGTRGKLVLLTKAHARAGGGDPPPSASHGSMFKEETRVGLIGESHMLFRLHHRVLQLGSDAGRSDVTELLSHLPPASRTPAAWINNQHLLSH